MQSFEVKFLQSALDDFEEIVLHSAGQNFQSARDIGTCILQTAENLTSLPKRGQFVPDKKIQNLGFRILKAEDYLLFYKINGFTIFIHRILHGKCNFPRFYEKMIMIL